MKSCCICLKTGQATGSHPLSIEFKISLPTTGIILILFSTQESSFFFFFPPSVLLVIFCSTLRILTGTVIFIVLQYLWEITPHTAKDTGLLFSFKPVLGHVSLLFCWWHPHLLWPLCSKQMPVEQIISLCKAVCNHLEYALEYKATSNMTKLGTRLRCEPCFWALAGNKYLMRKGLFCLSPPAYSHCLTVTKWFITQVELRMDSTFVLLFSKSQRELEGGEHKKLENNVTIRKKIF